MKLPAVNADELAKSIHMGLVRPAQLLPCLRHYLQCVATADALERVATSWLKMRRQKTSGIWKALRAHSSYLRLSLARIVESVLSGLKVGERDFGVSTGVIICGIRNIDPQELCLPNLPRPTKSRGRGL